MRRTVWHLEVRIPVGERVAPGWRVEYRVSGEDFHRVAGDVRMVGATSEDDDDNDDGKPRWRARRK